MSAPEKPAMPRDEDDDLDELPPMDGDEGDEEPPPEELDEEPIGAGAPGDPFDDSTGEGEPIDDVDFGREESGLLDDANDAEGLDVGAGDDIDEEERDLLSDTDESPIDDEDFAFGGDESQSTIDGGEEGFEEDTDELNEDELPRLDAGDDDDAEPSEIGELGDGWLVAEETTDEPPPPWDDRAWERAGGAALGAIDAVACVDRGALAAGARLVSVDVEGAVEVIEALGMRGGAARSLAVDAPRVVAVTPRAGVLVSEDGGAHFAEANGWRALVPRADADAAIDVVAAAGVTWGRTRSGALLRSVAGGAWEIVASDRAVSALARDEAGALAASLDGGVVSVARLEADRPAWRPLPGAAPQGARVHLASRAGKVALLVEGRGVFRAGDAGWTRIEGTASATAFAFADGDGVLLVALQAAGEDRAWLARCDDAAAHIVAEIGGGDDERGAEDGDADARVRALVWDDVHGVAWVGGGFGLLAFRPPTRSPRSVRAIRLD